MEPLLSLPESLRNQIQEAASGALGVNSSAGQPLDPVQRVMAEIARQSPELLVALVLANSGYAGVETVETEERSEDTVIRMENRGQYYTEVVPVKTRRTIRREVRFLSERSQGLRERQ